MKIVYFSVNLHSSTGERQTMVRLVKYESLGFVTVQEKNTHKRFVIHEHNIPKNLREHQHE